MPTIDLPEEAPLPGANTIYFPTFATMLYPREEERRKQWFASAMVGSYSHWRRIGAPAPVLEGFHGWLADVWEFTQAPKRVYEDGTARVRRVAASGQVLWYLLRIHAHHRERCKVEQAKALVVEFVADGQESVSESLVTKSWADFKTVSHLWANFILRADEGSLPGARNDEWATFLGFAEALREDAEKARILDPAETWKVPQDRGIPRPERLPVYEPLEAEKLSFLELMYPA